MSSILFNKVSTDNNETLTSKSSYRETMKNQESDLNLIYIGPG